jgi:hypothetical protein
MVATAAAQDHHAIRGIAVGTILMGCFASVNRQVEIRIVQRKIKAGSDTYSQSPISFSGVDDNTFSLLMFSPLSIRQRDATNSAMPLSGREPPLFGLARRRRTGRSSLKSQW